MSLCPCIRDCLFSALTRLLPNAMDRIKRTWANWGRLFYFILFFLLKGEGGGGERRDGMEESLYVLITYVVEKDGEENGGLWQ